MAFQSNTPLASWLQDYLIFLTNEPCELKEEYGKEEVLDENENNNVESVHHKAFASAFYQSPNLRMSPLQPHDIPIDMYKLSNGDEVTKLKERMSNSRIYASDYIEMFTTMIHLEEVSQSVFLTQFNQGRVRLIYSGKGREFKIEKTKEISKMSDAVEESVLDYFTLKPHSDDFSISGQILKHNKEFIFIKFDEDDGGFEYVQRNCEKETFEIYFHLNRSTFELQHNALKYMQKHNLFNVLINNPKYNEVALDESMPTNNYEFSGTLAVELNEEQKIAAINIVKAQNAPLPYILFGPAGTGKTRTLVAAIEEIVRSSDNCVLVCANSNAACDEIAERLLKVLHYGEMLRIYAKSYDKKKISDSIKPISNCQEDEIGYPSLKFFYKFRVIICTLNTAGIFTRAREYPEYKRKEMELRRMRCYYEGSIESSDYNSSHFSHIIIDEAASTNETTSLIAIAGLCTDYGQIHGQIVLAGDIKQLDAVTHSRLATQLGYSTSFMEQLFNCNLYKRNPTTGEYNQQYITQLVQNYRSHPAILHIPNELFYENKLQAKASTDIIDWFIGSHLLPSKKFPVIFKSIQGICKRTKEDFSLKNLKEANAVMTYIKTLLSYSYENGKRVTQSDIGIVTPYRLQSKILSQLCRRENFNEVTVGTAEVFQGQERPVMIVSTVRTDGILGFVKDPRRLNVVITRAKALLILIGDPHTLCLDENWRKLIEYCIRNNALIQGDKPFRIDSSTNDDLNEQFSDLQLS